MHEIYRPYVLRGKQEEAPGVATLFLSPSEGERPDFIPGQFVNIHLPCFGSEAKSYTIATTPNEKEFGITIREVGMFSRALLAHVQGNELLLSEPLGYFYPEDDAPRVFLAAGIGITPFMSILRSKSVVPTRLLYSNRTPEDAVFAQELEILARELPLAVKHFMTRAPGESLRAIAGRIDAAHIAEALEEDHRAEVYLCGSVGFVRDMRLHLRALGVPEEKQFTESFF